MFTVPQEWYSDLDTIGSVSVSVRSLVCLSQTDTSADKCVTDDYPRQLCYLGCAAPSYSLSCGGQVPDVAGPHYRDARMQHLPVQCPSYTAPRQGSHALTAVAEGGSQC